MPTAKSPLRASVLISGGGTTLQNLLARIDAGQLDVRIPLVLSSNARAGGLEIASRAGIPTTVVTRDSCHTPEAFSERVFGACRNAGVDVVVMGGFLKHVLIPADFENRVLNIHPALIPAFCGQGFYGRRVHEAVLSYGAKVSGCTVHFVDDDYDHGPIVLQRTVPVLDSDSPESLASRVFAAECEAYPDALRLCAAGRLVVRGRRVIELSESESTK